MELGSSGLRTEDGLAFLNCAVVSYIERLSCKLIHCLSGRLGFLTSGALTCIELTIISDGHLEPFSN